MFAIYKLAEKLQKQEFEEKERKKLVQQFNRQPKFSQLKQLREFFQKKRGESCHLDIYIKDKNYSYRKKIIETGSEFLKTRNYFATFVCLDEVESFNHRKRDPLNRAILLIEALRNGNLPKEKQFNGIKIQIQEEMYEKRAIMLLDESNNALSKYTKYLFLIERERYKEAINAFIELRKDLINETGMDTYGPELHSDLFNLYKEAKLNLMLADYCNNLAERIKEINPRKARAKKIRAFYFFNLSLNTIDRYLKENPSHSASYLHRAEVLEKLGKHREANLCYKHIFKNKLI